MMPIGGDVSLPSQSSSRWLPHAAAMPMATRQCRASDDGQRHDEDDEDGADAVGVGAVRADQQVEIGRDRNGGEESSFACRAAAWRRCARPEARPPASHAAATPASAWPTGLGIRPALKQFLPNAATRGVLQKSATAGVWRTKNLHRVKYLYNQDIT